MRVVIDITNVDLTANLMSQTQHPVFQCHADRIEKHREAGSGKKHQQQFWVYA